MCIRDSQGTAYVYKQNNFWGREWVLTKTLVAPESLITDSINDFGENVLIGEDDTYYVTARVFGASRPTATPTLRYGAVVAFNEVWDGEFKHVMSITGTLEDPVDKELAMMSDNYLIADQGFKLGTYKIQCDECVDNDDHKNASYDDYYPAEDFVGLDPDEIRFADENKNADGSKLVLLGNKELASFKNEIMAYPNPVTSDFTIELDQVYSEIKVKIKTTSGTDVSTIEVANTDKISSSLEGVESGVYLVEVQADNHFQTMSIVKE